MKTINSKIKGLVLISAILGSSLLIANADVYKKCAGCHGQNAEKKALGKSKIINTFTSEQIVTAIHGYKDGTYGGAMKGLMKGQVRTLSDKQIDDLSKYIPTLK